MSLPSAIEDGKLGRLLVPEEEAGAKYKVKFRGGEKERAETMEKFTGISVK